MRRIVPPVRLETARLVLRQWRQEDYAPYAAMNADKAVTAFLTIMLDRRESEAAATYFRAMIAWRGWGIWAVERKPDGVFIGSVGLHVPRVRLPFSPCVGLGWRLARAFWGQGYATEAANEAMRFGFDVLALPEIVAFTAVKNMRSAAVMRRLGMVTDPAWDFGHPDIPRDNPLYRYCLYRMCRQDWLKKENAKGR
ncbi:MAG: GNAT family N-acetyltransferase [Oxalobacter formigenes]|nr:GNAT family N-acetyltransferase [Oxalobacter formigenes]